MSCCLTDEQKTSREIERALSIDKKRQRREIKLLFLGTGESGKSTFIKQMRIIHGEGYSEQERRDFRGSVYQNILSAIQTIIKAMQGLDISYKESVNEDHARMIENVDHSSVCDRMDTNLVQSISSVWSDEGVQACYRRRNEYQVSDSAKYFLDGLARFSAEDYIPTEQDILRIRIPTSGIHEYMIQMKGLYFRLVDVGGQRGERTKWIHAFESVTAIMFLVATSEYDQVLWEAREDNRMKESLALFHTIISYQWFYDTSVILFLNKTDLLEEKIQYSHLADYFPDFKGPRQDVTAAKDFIKTMFEDANPDDDKQIFSHFTCATDTSNMKVVYTVVMTTIMDFHMRQFQMS